MQKPGKYFTLKYSFLNKVNRHSKPLANKSFLRPVVECGAACWNPSREAQVNALDRVQTKGAHFTNNTNYSDWEFLALGRAMAGLYALCKS